MRRRMLSLQSLLTKVFVVVIIPLQSKLVELFARLVMVIVILEQLYYKIVFSQTSRVVALLFCATHNIM